MSVSTSVMYRIATLPSWECRSPPAVRRRHERYWLRAELPLAEEWTFIINAGADPSTKTPERSVMAVGISELLAVLDELDALQVKAVYHLARGLPDDDDLMLNRLTYIQMGEDPHDGWRKVFIFGVESGPPFVDVGDHDALRRLENLVVVVRFSEPKVAPVSP